jgi:choline kinase
MQAIMLAAGVGSRLYGDTDTQPPKCLLKFDGKTLLRRHIEILHDLGIERLTLVLGYRKDEILDEARQVQIDICAEGFVDHVVNPDYRLGTVVSMHTAKSVLRSGSDVLMMDADVLYTRTLIEQLLNSPHANCLLVDRNLEPGDEPVKVCIENKTIVNFGKIIPRTYETMGEWPGFMKLSPGIARRMVEACAAIIGAGRPEQPCEDAIYDVLMAEPGVFGFEDVTGEPWIEIDFPEDLDRAKDVILPKLEKAVA